MSEKKLRAPYDMFYNGDFKKQKQEYPGVQKKMNYIPDCGEESYKGSSKLEGRKALITGGDSGIGRAAAIAYAREGADVAINYLPAEQEDADDVKDLIEKEGKKSVLIPGDLCDEEFARSMVDKANEELDGIDILVLNAGMQQYQADIMDLDMDQVRKTFETNIISMYYTTQQALKYMPKGSSIIATSSIQRYEPSPGLMDYAATKAAITAFIQALSQEMAPKGIRANTVAPGPIWTALQIAGGQAQDNLPEFGQSTDIGRAGQPAELAAVYVFLASEEASYVTGQTYGVTGGDLIG